MMFRQTIPILFFLLLVPRWLPAQPRNDSTSALHEGAFALLFQVDRDLTLAPFQGGAVAGKFHIASDRALRLTIGVRWNDGDGTALSVALPPDTNTMSANADANAVSVQSTIQFLWYLTSLEPLHLFVGAGPQIRYTREREDASQELTQGGQSSRQERKRTINNWEAGLNGSLGLEWFFSRSFSLHAEYGLGLLYMWRSSSETTKVTTNPPLPTPSGTTATGSARGWGFNADNFRFGLSAYF